MKKILLICVLVYSSLLLRSQAVLNEVYPQPGNGYHEFFELYNESNSVENLDNYTIVTYYEEGINSGFYVLDLPNANMAAHGYYVGASQNPFDIQLQLGQIANFSWNAMPAGGALSKWQRNGASYTSVAVPANLNDFMVRIVGGSDGVYHVFVYKNGILVNGVVGGINTTTLPGTIKSMPSLPVDMSGSSPDFTINFNAIPDSEVEFIPNSLGTNNGYYRSFDGLCGDWLKSDQPGQHNPGSTNGSFSSDPGNQLSISAIISQYAMEPTKALLTYNILSAPAAALPIVVNVYSDAGIALQFDINDVLIDSRTFTGTPTGSQFIVLPTWDVAVIIDVKSASDCYDTTLAIDNYWSVLPVNLISFQGNIDANNKTRLQWKVGNNEMINQFEVERSYDGKEFKTVALVFTGENKGVEDYMFYETIPAFEKVMYRLRITSKTDEVSYSRILTFQNKITTSNHLRIMGNPVSDQLTFNYTASADKVIDVKIYDMTGKVIIRNKVNSFKGDNLISFPLTSNMQTSMYTIEVTNGADIQTKKFIKQ
ncbi:MAG TPA: T9SS type A sorting domain-containing protein [Chitinophagaceae bacterium]|nr:T9SS type A sorting domain-containing protein [Chitinophagaceae bacterium]